MSDELAQEDEDAEDYDLESFDRRADARDDDDDDATLIGRRGPNSVGDDAVVFEIGDQDLSDDEDTKPPEKRRTPRPDHNELHQGEDAEREGLIGRDKDIDD